VVKDFAEALQKTIRRDMNNYSDDLANGVCRSYDEYQKLCGVIRGLAIAEENLLALLKKAEDNDN